ncbi:zinc-binding dehydrogenase [Sphingobium xenophagum]|uniref:zinc-binding dehydrogenase n=1 Tax=Sphingobium xenophagum TaxID=121428 RepID=UPI0026CC5B65
MTGGYAGGQAEYVRVPFSDVGPLVIPDESIRTTRCCSSRHSPDGLDGSRECRDRAGRHGRCLGCGPVGLFAVQSAFLMGAERVIAIDHFPRRLELARKFGAETINFEESKVYEALMEMTGGIGPDAAIDCVGLEAHGAFADNIIDQIKASTFLGTDRIHAIRQ